MVDTLFLNGGHLAKDLVRFQTKYISRNPIERYLNHRFHRTIHSLIKGVKPRSILDVGCGEGVTMRYLLDNIPEVKVEGVEIHLESLKIAKKMNPETKVYQGTIYELPFKANSYELVLCTEVLEHLQDPEAAFLELDRVSKKFIIVSVPNEPLWRVGNMIRFKYWKNLGNTPDHIQHWTTFGFNAIAKEYFRVIKMKVPITWTMLLCEKTK